MLPLAALAALAALVAAETPNARHGFLPRAEVSAAPPAPPRCERRLCHVAALHRLRGASAALCPEPECWSADIDHPTMLGLSPSDPDAQTALLKLGEATSTVVRTLLGEPPAAAAALQP
jgi:hypothetical protein